LAYIFRFGHSGIVLGIVLELQIVTHLLESENDDCGDVDRLDILASDGSRFNGSIYHTPWDFRCCVHEYRREEAEAHNALLTADERGANVYLSVVHMLENEQA